MAVPVHPLAIACCAACGLVQLSDPPPIETVRPRVPWIRYNEPEAHLDDLAARLLAACRRDDPTVIGVGPFETPLLERLQRHGAKTRLADLIASCPGGAYGYPYLETWQARLDARRMDAVMHAGGAADIVTCRYLLEHCHAPVAALEALSRVLSEHGIVVIEVPDSSKFLAAGDYCFLWEEHVSYFVEHSLAAMAEAAGYEVVSLIRYPGVLEDALVAVLRRPGQPVRRDADPAARAAAKDLFSRYLMAFPATRASIRDRVAALAGPARNGVALFGVGHQAIMFVNALGLGPLIGAVIDDDDNKRGMFPPGFEVAVTPSAALLENPQIRACLLAVSPRIEHKVTEKLAPLVARGVQLRTIYAGRPGSIAAG